MSEQALVEIALAIFGLFFTILGFLLRQKDERQQKDIEKLEKEFRAGMEVLWKKHYEDAEKLESLRIQIASEHYVKGELDSKFDRLDATFRDGIRGLTEKVEGLVSIVLTHLQKGDR